MNNQNIEKKDMLPVGSVLKGCTYSFRKKKL